MRIRFLISLLITAACVAPAQTHLNRAVLYPNGAELFRTGEVALQAGESLVPLAELDSYLPNSIGIKILEAGKGQVTLLEVVEQPKTREIQPTATDAEVQAIRDEVTLQKMRVEALERQRLVLTKYQSETVAAERLKAQNYEDWQRGFQAAEQAIQVTGSNQFLARKELERLTQKLAAAEAGARPVGIVQTTELMAKLNASEPTTIKYEVHYMIPAAGWTPSYEVRANSKGEVQVVFQGLIHQLTGEDWKGVHLSLSTCRPSRSLDLPGLAPWFLEEFVYRPMPRSDVAYGVGVNDFTTGAAESAPARTIGKTKGEPDGEVVVPQATVTQSTLAAVYDIAAPADIPSGRDAHKVLVQSMSLPGRTCYEVVPKLSLQAMFRAQITNTTSLHLLPGDCAVFLDGSYVGQTTLAAAPKEAVNVALGTDERIKVERDVKPAYIDRSLIGITTTRRYEERVTVKNQTPFAQEVVVKGQVPVSRNQKIKVSVLVPKDGAIDAQGMLEWRVVLKSGGQAELPLAYTVESPTSMRLQGIQ